MARASNSKAGEHKAAAGPLHEEHVKQSMQKGAAAFYRFQLHSVAISVTLDQVCGFV